MLGTRLAKIRRQLLAYPSGIPAVKYLALFGSRLQLQGVLSAHCERIVASQTYTGEALRRRGAARAPWCSEDAPGRSMDFHALWMG